MSQITQFYTVFLSENVQMNYLLLYSTIYLAGFAIAYLFILWQDEASGEKEFRSCWGTADWEGAKVLFVLACIWPLTIPIAIGREVYRHLKKYKVLFLTPKYCLYKAIDSLYLFVLPFIEKITQKNPPETVNKVEETS